MPAPIERVSTSEVAPRRRIPITPPTLGDVLITLFSGLFLGLISLGVSASYGVDGVGRSIAHAAIVAMHLALLWRTTHPVASGVVVYLGALTHFVMGMPLVPSDLLVYMALYSVTAHASITARRWALTGGLIGAAMQGFLVLSGGVGSGQGSILWEWLPGIVYSAMLAATIFTAWALGLLRRNRLVQIESLAERARRLERERDQQAQIATAAERARIAREMHDIVAHSLSIMIAQADGGRYAGAQNPAAATRALETIGETGRAALTDMRKILGVLRGNENGADLAPQPDESDLHALIQQVRETGLDVSFVSMGQPRPLPPGTGLALYRICQEALTNVMKHGGPTVHVTVLQQWHPTGILLQIDDDGRGAAAVGDGQGQGLVGMRERAVMLGGEVVAGPRSGGGFRVRLTLPLPGTPGTLPIGPGQFVAQQPVIAVPPQQGDAPPCTDVHPPAHEQALSPDHPPRPFAPSPSVSHHPHSPESGGTS